VQTKKNDLLPSFMIAKTLTSLPNVLELRFDYVKENIKIILKHLT
jgi:DUF438 domain-containing protein